MTQFHEGQEVEVATHSPELMKTGWRKAKIVYKTKLMHEDRAGYAVQFPDGTRGVFSAEHIRAVEPQPGCTHLFNENYGTDNYRIIVRPGEPIMVSCNSRKVGWNDIPYAIRNWIYRLVDANGRQVEAHPFPQPPKVSP
jgi:hypothetical protein